MRLNRLAVLACMLAGATLAWAQEPAPQAVEVVAGDYDAGGTHRFLWGGGYRALWSAPVRVPVLDLQREAGGLQPVMAVGRSQTLGLALRGGDGRSYTFRAVHKDLVRVLPEELRDTAVADIAQDQIAASLPASGLVAAALARAAGVLEPPERLFVMPDDPALGEFREQFGGALGTLSEFPTAAAGAPGTFGATRVIDSEEMFALLNRSAAERVDSAAFLRARLLDLLLGDWDRHAGQWRFAKLPGESGWQPIPEDRDQAFSRYEGFAMLMARDREPKFDRFGAEYQDLEGLTWNARSLDRRLLSGSNRGEFARIAEDMRARLTDAVISEAVAQLPPEYLAIEGERLSAALRARRDGLPAQAERFYEFLAGEVNLFGTDEDDLVLLDFMADGSVAVVLSSMHEQRPDACDADASTMYEGRTLNATETRSLRLYTGGGSDVLVLSGEPPGNLKMHVVDAGDGITVCDERSAALPFVSPVAGSSGKGTRVADGLWIAPPQPLADAGNPESSQGPMLRARRDWGSTRYRLPYFGVAPDLGVLLGAGLVIETYGFRKRPYAAQHEVRFGVAFGSFRPRLDYSGTFRSENRRIYWNLRALASGIETLNWFGAGNDTEAPLEREYYRVHQSLGQVEFRVARTFGDDLTLSTGPIVQYSHTEDDTDRLIGQQRPYGTGDLGQVGWSFGFNLNTRRSPVNRELKGSDDVFRFGPPMLGTGYTFDTTVRYYAPTWDLEEDYGRADVAASASYLIGAGTALGLRLGGIGTWGQVPYFDAAFLGGNEMRGLLSNRFAGDQAGWANAVLAQRIGHLDIVVPGRWGLMAVGNLGRVWLEGEDSDTVHWSWGGGVWWAPWDLQNALRILVANSDEGARGYLLLGFGI